MNQQREISRLHYLFDNDHPDQVWINAKEIIRRINPNYDFTILSELFRDVVDLYYGDYPGYLKVKTPYHDLRHTMDVFLCVLRLMHGYRLSGAYLAEHEVTVVALSALLHDVGYAQEVGDESGSGAKYTKTHVYRGIEFMRRYAVLKGWPTEWAGQVGSAMLCTNPALVFSEIEFAGERERLMGILLGTADLVGQMADRSYLEKLLFLYFEFKEANLGDYNSTNELLQRTNQFYEMTRKKLDQEFKSTYQFLSFHFREWFDTDTNFYMESIEKNMVYLAKLVSESKGLDVASSLKRRGIVEKAMALARDKGAD
jgi:hypothetical protein